MPRPVIAIMLLVAAMSFALGITLPVMEVDRLFVFSQTPSLTEIVSSLWSSGDYGLSAIVGAFSVAFPLAKLGAIFLAFVSGPEDGENHGIPRWMHALANWSMLDVVLAALVVFAAKTSGLAAAVSKPGLWFFALSAILTAILAKFADRRAHGHTAG
jgi:paraquat-inducible protein A